MFDRVSIFYPKHEIGLAFDHFHFSVGEDLHEGERLSLCERDGELDASVSTGAGAGTVDLDFVELRVCEEDAGVGMGCPGDFCLGVGVYVIQIGVRVRRWDDRRGGCGECVDDFSRVFVFGGCPVLGEFPFRRGGEVGEGFGWRCGFEWRFACGFGFDNGLWGRWCAGRDAGGSVPYRWGWGFRFRDRGCRLGWRFRARFR